ncbi:hypothetical protein BWQ96_06914 [Gracilariopsis chorda]|uniref:Uncharacterized protein n=1 Tax=Gracilariopsis chorda TaxID=448386 RepID=A0A2V3IMP0_9FLOR|nr:hypothetical protein BWQ96_06914 [Gracilariopsis chorda]|eukprot:PXF43351.1 hypothetical protein BWQ96_06914 [Gracilariopsis chorda]
MQTCALRVGILPGAALGGFLGGVIVTRLTGRLSRTRERTSLFVRRRARRRCPRCAGFGISRCTLCDGEGICSYTVKVTRFLPCPLCVMRRYIPCSMCNGSGVRPSGGLRLHFDTAIIAIRRCFDQARSALLLSAVVAHEAYLPKMRVVPQAQRAQHMLQSTLQGSHTSSALFPKQGPFVPDMKSDC